MNIGVVGVGCSENTRGELAQHSAVDGTLRRVEVARAVTCRACESALDEPVGLPLDERQPCPSCGSLSRRVEQLLESTIHVRSELRLKAKEPGAREPFVEQRVGDSYHRDSGRWNRLRRLIDRRHNRYVEHIEDGETGETLHDVDEPLTDHIDHGSARKSSP
jgi:hypothetical protein